MSALETITEHARDILHRLDGAVAADLKDAEAKLTGLGTLVSEARGALTPLLDKLPPEVRAEVEAVLGKLTEGMDALLGSTHPAQ